MSPHSRSEFKRQIKQIDPIRFEQFVADIWSQRGWKTNLTSTSHDRGIDVIAVTDGLVSRKEAIQVKRYQSEKVSSREVREYASIPNQEGDIDNIIIVTSSSLSQPARQAANDLNVKSINGDDLYTIVIENGLISSLSDYMQTDKFESRSLHADTEMTDTISAQENQFNHSPPIQQQYKITDYDDITNLSTIVIVLLIAVAIVALLM